MSAPSESCFRHPGRATRRRCERCHRPICAPCRLKIGGHTWCGDSCRRRHLAAARRRELAGAARRIAGRPVSPLLAAVPLLFVLALALFVDRSVADLRRLDAVDPGIFAPTAPTSIDAVEPAGGTSLFLSGTAPAGALVVVFEEDRWAGASLAGPAGWGLRLDRPADSAPLPSRLQVVALVGGKPVGLAEWSRPGEPVEPVTVGRPSPPRARDIMRGPAGRRELALTLDAGSSDTGATEILDVLRAEGVQATIFLTGEFIRRFPAVVRRAVADGHEFGNHTWDHPHLTRFAETRRHDTRDGVDRRFLEDQLARTAAEFETATGRRMSRWWRAPFGEHNGEIRRWAADLGWTHVGWTRGPDFGMDSLDWVSDEASRNYESGDEIVDRLLEFDTRVPGGADGGIILMHLGTDRTAARLDASLPRLIAGYRARGLSFVTVSQLLRREPAGSAR